MRFFLLNSKKSTTFAPWTCAEGCLTSAAEGSRHIKKAFIDALFWRVEMSQVSKSVSGLSNGRCPTGYRLSLLCLLVRLLHIHICAHAYLNYVAREYILYSAWASRCCSKLIGNATASTRGTTAVGIHVFLCTYIFELKYEMNLTKHKEY